MIDQRLIERIHESLEGNLTPEEHQWLQEQLAMDPEAARYYADWQQIEKGFEQSRKTAPDIELAHEVIRQIHVRKNTPAMSEPVYSPPFWRHRYVKFSFVFVAGIFLGFLLFTFVIPPKPAGDSAVDRMKGTLYGSGSTDRMKVADNLLYEAPGVRATFEVLYSGTMVEARISLNCQATLLCFLDFNPNDFQPLTVTSSNTNSDATFTASSGWVKLVNTGDNQYIIWLRPRNNLPNQMRIRLVSDDMTIYQNTVTVNKE